MHRGDAAITRNGGLKKDRRVTAEIRKKKPPKNENRFHLLHIK